MRPRSDQLPFDLIARRYVTCALYDQDEHGRRFGTCYVAELNLNRDMLAAGEAIAYRHISTA
jgi:endonuclease YncB( thermonuclease family)